MIDNPYQRDCVGLPLHLDYKTFDVRYVEATERIAAALETLADQHKPTTSEEQQ